MFQPQPNPTPELIKNQKRLYMFLVLGLVLNFARFSISMQLAFNDLILFLILWCAAASFNYCLIVLFIVYTIFSSLIYFFTLGTLMQIYIITGHLYLGRKVNVAFILAILVSTLVYNVVVIKIAFGSYKVFKDHMYRNLGVSGQQGNERLYNANDDRDDRRDEENRRGGFEPFIGRGVRLG